MVKQESKPTKRLLHVDLDTLEMAFSDASYDTDYFLDMETGEVIIVTPDIRTELNRLRGKWESNDQTIDFSAFVQQSETQEWMLEMMGDALRVEEDIDSRYVAVPPVDSSEGYRDMQDFIKTVQDELLQRRLQQALDSEKPFRQFKTVLLNFPQDREDWFEFRGERIIERILSWLDSWAITPIIGNEEP